MGLARKITVQLQYGLETPQKLVLRKDRQETYLHILLKILSYCYFWGRDNVVIEPSYRVKGYKPDLLVLGKNPDPRMIDPIVELWVECKKVSLNKLERLSIHLPYAEIFWFHELRVLERTMSIRTLKKHPRLDKIEMIGVSGEGDGVQDLIHDLKADQPKWTINQGHGGLTIRNTADQIRRIRYNEVKT